MNPQRLLAPRSPGERRDKAQFFRVALRGGDRNTRETEQPTLTFGPPMAPRSLLLPLLLTVAVRQTAGRSKGQPMVGGAADAPEKRSCADIVGAAAAECPRSVAQAMSVAELQRVCDLKMMAMSTTKVVQQVRGRRRLPSFARRRALTLPSR